MSGIRRWTLVGTLVLAVTGAWFWRTSAREAFMTLRRASLPVAAPYATSTRFLVQHSTSTDPLVWKGPLPRSVNLAVPFVLQAPKQNWSLPYQEACEEASAIMVDGYYHGRRRFSTDEQDRAILSLVDFEKKTLGFYEDTSATETARFIRERFGWKRVLVRDLRGTDDIKRALANGYPVLVPASGKALKNPNFRNGGPKYHMLVVKGYLPDGRWITNDPGTRNGADYVYANAILMNAAHDWNGGDVVRGKRMMIVILPGS